MQSCCNYSGPNPHTSLFIAGNYGVCVCVCVCVQVSACDKHVQVYSILCWYKAFDYHSGRKQHCRHTHLQTKLCNKGLQEWEMMESAKKGRSMLRYVCRYVTFPPKRGEKLLWYTTFARKVNADILHCVV